MKRNLGIVVSLVIALIGPATVYAQQGGNVYDPSGGSPLAGDSTIAFTKVGGGYSVHVPAGGGGSPGGTNGAIQYNNSGAFGGAVITGLVKGNGTSAPAAAVSATDYAPATTGSSILKASSGGFANAVSGTDYAPATSGTSILKASSGGFANAVSGTDYQPAIAGNTLASHNFANSINAAGTVAGAQPTAADIAAGTFSGANTFSSPPTMSGANISATTIPTGSLATVQGNGTKVQLSTGTTTTNDCVKYDANGNTVDNGSSCGGAGSNPIVPHTVTESAGAATLVVNSGSVPAIDKDEIAANANGTWTFPSTMADGEILYVIVSTSGTGYTSTFADGALVTAVSSLVTGVTGGAVLSPSTAGACGVPPATGAQWFAWQYTSANTTMTLTGCGIGPAAATLTASILPSATNAGTTIAFEQIAGF